MFARLYSTKVILNLYRNKLRNSRVYIVANTSDIYCCEILEDSFPCEEADYMSDLIARDICRCGGNSTGEVCFEITQDLYAAIHNRCVFHEKEVSITFEYIEEEGVVITRELGSEYFIHTEEAWSPSYELYSDLIYDETAIEIAIGQVLFTVRATGLPYDKEDIFIEELTDLLAGLGNEPVSENKNKKMEN